MEGLKLDTLENIEKAMPLLETALKTHQGVAAPVLAPLAEAIATLARELRQLRDRRP